MRPFFRKLNISINGSHALKHYFLSFLVNFASVGFGFVSANLGFKTHLTSPAARCPFTGLHLNCDCQAQIGVSREREHHELPPLSLAYMTQLRARIALLLTWQAPLALSMRISWFWSSWWLSLPAVSFLSVLWLEGVPAMCNTHQLSD